MNTFTHTLTHKESKKWKCTHARNRFNDHSLSMLVKGTGAELLTYPIQQALKAFLMQSYLPKATQSTLNSPRISIIVFVIA